MITSIKKEEKRYIIKESDCSYCYQIQNEIDQEKKRALYNFILYRGNLS